MKTLRIIAGLGLTMLALAGCGGRQPLKPVEGQRLPAVPVGAATAPTSTQLLTPSIQARPERIVELLTQSRERTDDDAPRITNCCPMKHFYFDSPACSWSIIGPGGWLGKCPKHKICPWKVDKDAFEAVKSTAAPAPLTLTITF